MAQYVDGYLLPLPKKSVAQYRRIAQKAARVWRKHGALEYRECVGDDLKIKGMVSFNTSAGTKASETVIFSWIVYRSRAHRDAVNAKVMKDPRMLKIMQAMGDPKKHPFDMKRMMYGGFKTLVKA